MGIRSPVHSFTPCFVICNTWPSWLAVLPSFGFQCTHLVFSNPSAAWLSLMLRPHPGCLLLRLHPHSLPSELSLYQYGFMQGSSRLAQFCPTFSSINFIYNLDFGQVIAPLPHFSPLTLAHFYYGGLHGVNGNSLVQARLHNPPCPRLKNVLYTISLTAHAKYHRSNPQLRSRIMNHHWRYAGLTATKP